MLQAHSSLWHYLWVTPNVLLLVLAFLVWKRGSAKHYPAFFVYMVLSATAELIVYAADVTPSVTPDVFWRIDWACLLVEGTLKFVLIGEIFSQVFGAYTALAGLGQFLIRGVGIILILTSAVAAAYAPSDSLFGIISGAHLLEQAIYLVECGILVFIFLFAMYFQLRPTRPIFGIALGLAISACVHLATWGIAANAGLPPENRVILDFINMATYHGCILIWFYYLLAPVQAAATTLGPPLENTLDVWNRELERLLHQ
jgi:hypothetical protein